MHDKSVSVSEKAFLSPDKFRSLNDKKIQQRERENSARFLLLRGSWLGRYVVCVMDSRCDHYYEMRNNWFSTEPQRSSRILTDHRFSTWKYVETSRVSSFIGWRARHSAFRKSKSGEWGTGLVSTYFHVDKDRWGSVRNGEERWGTLRNVEERWGSVENQLLRIS